MVVLSELPCSLSATIHWFQHPVLPFFESLLFVLRKPYFESCNDDVFFVFFSDSLHVVGKSCWVLLLATMSWFSKTNITSITGQLGEHLSNFTRDVLNEEVEENSLSRPSSAAGSTVDDFVESSRRIDELERTASKLREEASLLQFFLLQFYRHIL